MLTTSFSRSRFIVSWTFNHRPGTLWRAWMIESACWSSNPNGEYPPVGLGGTELADEVLLYELSLRQEQEFENATTCHICEETFRVQDVKHRDHCHFTGKYRGIFVLMPVWNLNFWQTQQCIFSLRKELEVVWHNAWIDMQEQTIDILVINIIQMKKNHISCISM